jgi:glycosyltransferase involved in cell wall biosynthesis
MPDYVGEHGNRVPISVVINTLNEASNLAFTLRSVRTWVDEIVVVDMESEDSTVEIARKYGAAVYSHPKLGFADPARAFAVSKATNQWILVLDADEIVPPTLATRLVEIAQGDGADAVRIPWANYFFGSPLRYSGWGPQQNRHARFFRRDKMHFSDKIHAYMRPSDDARIIDLPTDAGLEVLHFNYTDIGQFIEKLNRYTTIEAQQAHGRRRRTSGAIALWHATREFGVRYVRYQGFRDGWRGFYLAALMAFYRLASDAKLAELDRGLGPAAVRDTYTRTAENVLEGYES